MAPFNESNNDYQPASLEKLKEIVLSAGIPSHAMETVEKTIRSLSGLNRETAEYTNTLTYVNYLTRFPWSKKTQDNKDLNNLYTILNKNGNVSKEVITVILNNITSRTSKENNQVKILVVDDERIALKNLAHLLKKEGYVVETCENGEDAIEILGHIGFDIVMTDLRMAKVDGIKVLETTKRLYPDTHVIVITGYATTETAVEAMRKGAFHYIMKPIQIDELRAIVKEALERNKTLQHGNSLLCITCSSESQKADIGRAIAEATGRNFAEIFLGDIKVESDIHGLSRINGGVSPGCIIDNVCKTGTLNPVIMLHDLDAFDNNLFPLLQNAMNSEKNNYFVDKYLEVPFDLSDVLFIATASKVTGLSSPLIEFLKIVEV